MITDAEVTLADNTFLVTGTFNQVEDYIAFPDAEQTGYYLPLELNGAKGEALVFNNLSGQRLVKVFGQTDDTDTTMINIMAIDSANPVRTFTAYKNVENAELDKDGTVYTVDCSTAIFVE